MAQKFTSLEDAATQLGISKDRLNQLREAGKVRAYRDGASWKFRAEDIEKLETDGLPSLDGPPSDLALDLDDDVIDEPATPAEASALELDLADEELSLGPMASDIALEDIDEPTVAGISEEDSDEGLAIEDDRGPADISDSILLSEKELGESMGRPPSTIIGKAELDADLDLSPIDEAPASDVKLAGMSGVLPGLEDDALDLPSPSGEFAKLEELEVDLEAESSRILSPEDVAKVRSGASAVQLDDDNAEISDLELAPLDSQMGRAASDIGLGGESAVGSGLANMSALELDDDDDQVLGEGSDVTLSGESSGINIISPSDSGLALDEVSLDLSGASAIGSSLDLGSSISEQDMSLGSMIMAGEGLKDAKGGEDFQLTPLGEEGSEEEERDSSQVIALEEISEETVGPAVDVGMGESGMMRGEEFGMGLVPGAAPVGVVSAAADTPFSLWNVMGLVSCLVLLGMCGMMLFDLLRNIWSWDGVTPLNSSLLEVLNPFL